MSGSETPPQRLPRPSQLEELTPDQLLAVVLRLAMEIGVLRDRLRTHEALLEAAGILSADAIEDYEPDADETRRRMEEHTRLIDGIIADISGDGVEEHAVSN